MLLFFFYFFRLYSIASIGVVLVGIASDISIALTDVAADVVVNGGGEVDRKGNSLMLGSIVVVVVVC